MDNEDYIRIAALRDEDNANRLADILRRKLYPNEEYVNHIDDVIIENSNISFVCINKTDYDKYPKREELLVYCQGFVEGAEKL